MTFGIDEWAGMVLSSINQNASSEIKRLYSSEGNLDHYLGLTLKIYKSTSDIVLSKAAMVHGVPLSDRRDFLNELVDQDVENVLEGLRQIDSLDPNEKRTIDCLVPNVLPIFKRDPRVIYLYILENLNHLDPDGTFEKWSIDFKKAPVPLPDINNILKYQSNTFTRNNSEKFCDILSKTAEFYNLWTEKIVFENAVLFFKNKDIFQSVVNFCVNYANYEDLYSHQIKEVHKCLGDDLIISVQWEWLHVAGIYNRLSDGIINNQQHKHLYKCGRIIIVCKDERSCYVSLYLLHKKFGGVPGQLQDLIGIQNNRIYKAINTTIIDIFDIDGFRDGISIVLIPGMATNNRRLRPSSVPPYFILNREIMHVNNSNKISVFTPDGLKFDLIIGSSVLNFIYKLNSKLLIYFKAAKINNIYTEDILKILNNGDVVNIYKSDELRYLPNNWLLTVPQETYKSIRYKYVSHLAPSLRVHGKEWLVKQLSKHGIECDLESELLASIVDEILDLPSTKLFPKAPKNHDSWCHNKSEWWFQQIGIYFELLSGNVVLNNLRIKQIHINLFLDELRKIIQTMNFKKIVELNFPKRIGKKVKQVRYCSLCSPSISSELMGTIMKDLLTLHRRGTECAKNGITVTNTYRIPDPLYILIETENIIGIGKTILESFLFCHIDIIDLAACRVGAYSAVFRMMIEHISKEKREKLFKKIESIKGITKIVLANEQPDPFLESNLPPRKNNFSFPSIIDPYITGQIIRDDYSFYGMENEICVLLEIFKRVQDSNLELSEMAFVNGAKRTGKTSLSYRFTRIIRDNYYPKCFTFTYNTPLGVSFGDIYKDLLRSIKEEILSTANTNNIDLNSYKFESFDDVFAILNSYFDFPKVIVIDEFPGLLHETTVDSERKIFRMFRERLKTIKKAIIIYIGPKATLSVLNKESKMYLNKCSQITIGNLNKVATKSLLCAEKYRPRYNIYVDDKLSDEIFHFAGGNPYWINLIGSRYWKKSDGVTTEIVHYEKDIYQSVINDVISQPLYFTDKVVTKNPIRKNIINIFVENNNTALSLLEIYSIINNNNYKIIDISNELDRMSDVGTLRMKFNDKNELWEIYPPILFDHLTRYMQYRLDEV